MERITKSGQYKFIKNLQPNPEFSGKTYTWYRTQTNPNGPPFYWIADPKVRETLTQAIRNKENVLVVTLPPNDWGEQQITGIIARGK